MAQRIAVGQDYSARELANVGQMTQGGVYVVEASVGMTPAGHGNLVTPMAHWCSGSVRVLEVVEKGKGQKLPHMSNNFPVVHLGADRLPATPTVPVLAKSKQTWEVLRDSLRITWGGDPLRAVTIPSKFHEVCPWGSPTCNDLLMRHFGVRTLEDLFAKYAQFVMAA